MTIIAQLEKEQMAVVSAKRQVPDFAPGDTVIVNVKVVEGERSRIQAYEGLVIGRSVGGIQKNLKQKSQLHRNWPSSIHSQNTQALEAASAAF